MATYITKDKTSSCKAHTLALVVLFNNINHTYYPTG